MESGAFKSLLNLLIRSALFLLCSLSFLEEVIFESESHRFIKILLGVLTACIDLNLGLAINKENKLSTAARLVCSSCGAWLFFWHSVESGLSLLGVTLILFSTLFRGQSADFLLLKFSPLISFALAFLALSYVLIASDQKAYFWLFSEGFGAITLGEIFCLIYLILIGSLNWKFVTSLVLRAAYLMLCLVVLYKIAFWIIDGRASIFFKPQDDFGLSAVILIMTWMGLSSNRLRNEELSANCKFRLQQNLLSGLIVLALLVFICGGVFVYRNPVPLKQKSNWRIDAGILCQLLASEDPIFGFHHGIDFKRLRDAARELYENGEYRRGGSTISMQLAKVIYLSQDRTIARKLEQLMLGVWIELLYSKDEIIRAYLNTVPYAPSVIGIEAAAKQIFNKSPDLLTQTEGLQLILSIYDPTHYNPYINPMPEIVQNRARVISARTKRGFNNFLIQLKNISFKLE